MSRSFLALLAFGAAVRAAIWLAHGQDVMMLPADRSQWAADCAGILADPWGALAWEHTRPPLMVATRVFQCALWPAFDPTLVNMIVVSIADVFAAALIYLTFTRLSINPKLAIAAAAAWSVALIAWEYYRASGTHNHLNVFLVTLLVHATVLRFSAPGRSADLAFGGAGALLLSAYGLAVAVVPLFAVLSAPWAAGVRRAIVSIVIAISLPAILWTGVSYKNFKTVGIFSTSTYVSLNMAQFGFISLGYERPDEKLLGVVHKLSPSPWWRWCFERQRKNNRTPEQAVLGLYGSCLQYDDPKSLKAGLEAAESLKDQPFIDALNTDLGIVTSAPWNLRIGSPQKMASRTEVVFVETSKRLYAEIMRTEPFALLRTFFMANRSFFIWGPLMFDGVHHEPDKILAPRAVNWLATLFGLAMMIAVVTGPILALRIGWRAFAVFRQSGLSGLATVAGSEFLIAGALLTILVVSVPFNAIACCENGRQFQSLSPIPLLAAVFLMDGALRRFGIISTGRKE